MKKKTKHLLALSLCLFLTAGYYPVTAQAAPASGDIYAINLNRSGQFAGISDPLTNSADQWLGSRIAFGSKNGAPLLWRVLDAQVAQVTERNVMLLHSDSILEKQEINAQDKAWNSSSIRAALNDTAQFLKGFQKAELSNLYSGGKAAGNPLLQEGVSYSNPGLERGVDNVFLLSAEEASSKEYGYGVEKNRKMTVSSGDTYGWLLRSQPTGTENWAEMDRNGKLNILSLPGDSSTPGPESGIAPAMYLDTSHILFTSPADVKKPAAFSKITKVMEDTLWKLTLQAADASMDAALKDSGNIVEPGNSIVLTHKNASKLLPGATQVSALLTDPSGHPVLYGKIGGSTAAASSVPIPGDLAPGTYQLYVFAEDINEARQTDYASALGKPVSLKVMALPVISTLPVPGSITYGQSLSDSPITGGIAIWDNVQIPGSYRWSNPTVQPTAADSNLTSYEVVFTPQDTEHYKEVHLFLSLTVNKVENAPNMPAAAQTVEYTVTKVNQVPLPEGWSWRSEYSEKDLPAGGVLQAIAAYRDVQNYQNYEQIITISRKACSHTGGTATCIHQAVCDICHQPYGNLDPNRHGETQLIGVKASSCTETGYTGDTYCKDCGQLIAKGREEGMDSHYYNNERTLKWASCTEKGLVEHYCSCGDSYTVDIPALGHDYESKITTSATAQKEGVKTYTCKRCGNVYTEKLPKLASSGGNGQNSSGGAVSIPDNTPYIKGNSAVKGWDSINKEIGKATEGSTLNVSLNNTQVLPAKTLEALKGKNVTLVLDLGNNMKWSISGSSVTAEKPGDLKLSAVKNSGTIPKELAEKLAGERDSMQLTLSQEGAFGCTASLQLLLDSKKAGYYANLFHYNTESETLDYETSVRMDGKGYAELPFTHASSYLIILDTTEFNGTESFTPEPAPTDTPATPLPTQAPEPDGSADNTFVTIAILVILILAGIGMIAFVALRSRRNGQDG